MLGNKRSDEKLIEELIKQLSDFNSFFKGGVPPYGSTAPLGNYFFVFDPSNVVDPGIYKRSMRLISTVDDVLRENYFSVKSRGFTYVRDAICIITDLRTMDVCFEKEVYPLIAKKHAMDDPLRIEHDIRNALNSAYRRYSMDKGHAECLMDRFNEKPTNKPFILEAEIEVSNRLLKECRND